MQFNLFEHSQPVTLRNAVVDAAKLMRAEQGSATPPERCLRLIMTLLALERQGRHAEVVDNRRQLRHTNATLFAMYMQNR
ncbi:hypothetical protein GPA19_02455 [Azoarcus indigens]|uniref:Uncharacterized protein n=1 Tax=Azoarcus indigens TaxID=29545 RepID=A0A4R6EDS2_9RHOO|nr:hypothetical protein [Azoarcus indigens]NMG63812.1 hypothetical protein [Azoarcus indigens]TDN56351.1 hypothetical protein C7389_102287 [Azoarcus indigens]